MMVMLRKRLCHVCKGGPTTRSPIGESLYGQLTPGGGFMETIKVKDWMAPLDECAIISEDATLYEAVLALETAKERYDVTGYTLPAVIVLEKSGRVIGKLSQLDILRSLEPKYAEMGDLKKIAGYGLSADLLRSMIDRYDLWKAPLNETCRTGVWHANWSHHKLAFGRRVH